ncbi:MAG: hypothetical protein EU521_01885 [Promethearchaeota archaeon]|nr:MAG: hypothetical protein EU521_01885 [Candidatus Lokiarchaeota archaeon]
MSEKLVLIEGIVSKLAKSDSENFAFYLQEETGKNYYCFTTQRIPIVNLNDNLKVIGVPITGSKIRVEYFENVTEKKVYDVTKGKFDWSYKATLWSTLIITIITIIMIIGLISIQFLQLNYVILLISSIILGLFSIFIGSTLLILIPLTLMLKKNKEKKAEIRRSIEQLKGKIND